MLERALTLIRPLRLDVNLELDLAEAQQAPQERAAIAEQAAKRAREIGDRAAEALALVVVAQSDLEVGVLPDVDDLERLAREALALLEPLANGAALRTCLVCAQRGGELSRALRGTCAGG